MGKDIISELSSQISQKFSIDKLLFYSSIEVESHVVKKNNRPIFKHRGTGSFFLGKGKRLVGAEDYLIQELKMARIAQEQKESLKDRLWVVCHFYFHPQAYYTLKGTINKKMPDLSNLLELPADCLTKAGVIEDDTLIDSWDLSRRLIGEKTKLEIFILKYVE